MKPATEHFVAREWLRFVALLILGLTVLPLGVQLVAKGEIHPGAFYAALFSSRECLSAWAVALAPYIIWQVIRITIWAAKITQ